MPAKKKELEAGAWSSTRQPPSCHQAYKPGPVPHPCMGARRWPFIWDAYCQAPPATNPGGSPGNETGGFEAAAPPLFGLAPGGVYRAVLVTKNAVRSYR